ncbi:hypothetical protein LTR35_000671 [Friedmanniomyces endolithicus]|uniref:Uncharacterized protein n=1 Tax=Friedmanniomyces endolithicus TaxID=329885 RepID=A0AAN6F8K0_9PEZI|nr:hypothetical protein LTS00_012190 [Friedmanniomyces endolithicus]KAK0292640.1 hypothetical protein LTR35_000671 [Friedmanniomyces endolithicus]KAK0305990.1 hypothetical protein LTR82_016546 [Friedmanniomyces endolithicus]KAK1007618.1 hypothetical protein LTR54_006344 [Friedmanniomyces endolithicus]
MEPSPLVELAPELRNRIYELAFTNPPIELTWTTYYDSVPRPVPHTNRRLGLALTATCKQIKEECGRGMFFANNDFIIFCRPGNSGYSRDDTRYADVIRSFIATIGFGNALAARTLSLSQARIDTSLFRPAIEQLHPLCRAIRLPLKIWLSGRSSLEIDMVRLRRTGDSVADRLDMLSWPRTMGPAPHGTLLREAPKVDLLSDLRRIAAVACDDSATHGR